MRNQQNRRHFRSCIGFFFPFKIRCKQFQVKNSSKETFWMCYFAAWIVISTNMMPLNRFCYHNAISTCIEIITPSTIFFFRNTCLYVREFTWTHGSVCDSDAAQREKRPRKKHLRAHTHTQNFIFNRKWCSHVNINLKIYGKYLTI